MTIGPLDQSAIVVDASVSLKWVLLDEDGIAQAEALLDFIVGTNGTIVAPSLWVFEVTNSLVMATRRGRMSAEEGTLVLDRLLALDIHAIDPEPQDVYRVATRFSISAYDAAYVALAEALEVTLWTGDRRLQRATQPAAGFVRWIGEYRTAEG